MFMAFFLRFSCLGGSACSYGLGGGAGWWRGRGQSGGRNGGWGDRVPCAPGLSVMTFGPLTIFDRLWPSSPRSKLGSTVHLHGLSPLCRRKQLSTLRLLRAGAGRGVPQVGCRCMLSVIGTIAHKAGTGQESVSVFHNSTPNPTTFSRVWQRVTNVSHPFQHVHNANTNPHHHISSHNLACFTMFHRVTVLLVELVVEVMVEVSEVVVAQDLKSIGEGKSAAPSDPLLQLTSWSSYNHD